MATAIALKDNVLALNGPIGILYQYMAAASAIPILTAEEEFELATRLRETNDLEAAQKLVISHLRFVAHIARGYTGYGLPIGDLIQEGNVGLMKAVKHFDPNVGVRLVSFAVHWIRAEIHEYVLRNWRQVKIATTKAQRKLFFNLRKAKKHLGWLSKDETEAVASDLGVSIREVTEMEKRLSGRDISFDPAPSVARGQTVGVSRRTRTRASGSASISRAYSCPDRTQAAIVPGARQSPIRVMSMRSSSSA